MNLLHGTNWELMADMIKSLALSFESSSNGDPTNFKQLTAINNHKMWENKAKGLFRQFYENNIKTLISLQTYFKIFFHQYYVYYLYIIILLSKHLKLQHRFLF